MLPHTVSPEAKQTTNGSSINGRSLSYGALTGPVFVPGVGQFGPTLAINAPGGLILGMVIAEPWVLVKVKNNLGKAVTLPIPFTAFTHTKLVD